jgi:Flp pilus assembly protein TadD
VLAEVILPAMRLYSVAEYVVARLYRYCRPDERELALAVIYEEAGKIELAEERLRRAIAIRSNGLDNHLFLGQFLARHNRIGDARRAFEQARALALDSPTQLEDAGETHC